MIIAIPVTPDGTVDLKWGKARTVAIAEVEGEDIIEWTEHEVKWDEHHDATTEGAHHAAIVTFLRENEVEAVILNHCGAPMLNTMTKMGLIIATDAEGDAKDIVAGTAPLILEAMGGVPMAGSGGGGCGCGNCGCGAR
ncbi:hypothetical protein I6E29_08520 [Arcanobacterium haemolyticum]|nr:hypothetical protein [Arcanobacterium haemolyticum]